tara:strand:- start:589 stop:762 length:174 start_codon:yes stop_codon:yes gene_type:complete
VYNIRLLTNKLDIMANCKNCGLKLSCSCKVRKAKDGKECCTACVTKYNNQLTSTQGQ